MRIDEPETVRLLGSDILNYLQARPATPDKRMGYRGQANSDWELKPSLARLYESLPPERRTVSTYREVQAKLLRRFKENLITNGDLPPEEVARGDLWQYGQHFGLPTPLLDWTYSPYVALFFAARDPSPQPEGLRAIWQLNLSVLHSFHVQLDQVEPIEGRTPPLEPIEVLRELSPFNKRLSYQQGFLTRHDAYYAFEPWLRNVADVVSHPNADPPLLTKIEFRLSEVERSRLMHELDGMNINSRVLFPDIKGSVDDARDYVEHDVKPRTVSLSFSADTKNRN